jgi:hypothetical protein
MWIVRLALDVNLLGTEQKLAIQSIVTPRNGYLTPGDFQRFLPITGSPFPWGNRDRGAH